MRFQSLFWSLFLCLSWLALHEISADDSRCDLDEFECVFSRQTILPHCIPRVRLCNSFNNCKDGSDEDPKECDPEEFLLNTEPHDEPGAIPRDKFGSKLDKNEEDACLPLLHFTCLVKNQTKCFELAKKCDGVKDCTSGFDERDDLCKQYLRPVRGADNVPPTTSLPPANNQKFCSQGKRVCPGTSRCIFDNQFCDGSEDCVGGTDELPQNCPSTSSQDSPPENQPPVQTAPEQSNYIVDPNPCPFSNDFFCNKSSPIANIRTRCISNDLVCDQVSDCAQGEDELNCPPVPDYCSTPIQNGGCQHICQARTNVRVINRLRKQYLAWGAKAPLGDHTTHVCSCKDGYMLNADGFRCNDIDQCAVNNGKCTHKCINMPGGFTCECAKGYTLDPLNRRQCRASDVNKLFLLGLHATSLRELRLLRLTPASQRELENQFEGSNATTAQVLTNTLVLGWNSPNPNLQEDNARGLSLGEATMAEFDALNDLVFWASKPVLIPKSNGVSTFNGMNSIRVAPIELGVLMSEQREQIETSFRNYIQGRIQTIMANNPKFLASGISDQFIREEFSKYEQEVLMQQPWYARTAKRLANAGAIMGTNSSDKLSLADVDATRLLSREVFSCSQLIALTNQTKCFIAAIAYDWLNFNLYFVEEYSTAIWALKVNTSRLVPVIQMPPNSLIQITSLALDPVNGFILYSLTSKGRLTTIYKANLDGSQRTPLVNVSAINAPPGQGISGLQKASPTADGLLQVVKISIDYPGNRFYFVQWGLDSNSPKTIESCTVTGTDCRLLLKLQSGKHEKSTPFGLAVFEDIVYWVDLGTSSLYTCEKFDCSKTNTLLYNATSANPLRDVLVLTRYRQPEAGTYGPCVTQGSECSYMCLPYGGKWVSGSGSSRKAYRCICPVGSKPKENEATACVPGSEPIMEDPNVIPPFQLFPDKSSDADLSEVLDVEVKPASKDQSGPPLVLSENERIVAIQQPKHYSSTVAPSVNEDDQLSPRAAVVILVSVLAATLLIGIVLALITYLNYIRRSRTRKSIRLTQRATEPLLGVVSGLDKKDRTSGSPSGSGAGSSQFGSQGKEDIPLGAQAQPLLPGASGPQVDVRPPSSMGERDEGIYEEAEGPLRTLNTGGVSAESESHAYSNQLLMAQSGGASSNPKA